MSNFSAERLQTALSQILATAAQPDGLAVVASDDTSTANKVVVIPDRLLGWLLDLRLLRHVPLAYLVPDPQLFPSESIRFFHLDATWIDRLIDGAMSAGNIGTLDMTFTAATLTKLRKLLDERLTKGLGGVPTCGMLIRSELVERWPDLIVRALPDDKVAVVRQEMLSRSIMIVLFAGLPTEVQIREPDVGLRFGVESANNSAPPYTVNARDEAGKELRDDKGPIDIRLLIKRVIDFGDLRSTLHARMKAINSDVDIEIGSRYVATNLRQPPYVARFRQKKLDDKTDMDPDLGSRGSGNATISLRRGRTVTVQQAFARRGILPQGED